MPAVSNVMVVGDKYKFLSILVTLATKPKASFAEGEYPFTDDLTDDARREMHTEAKTVQEAKEDESVKKYIKVSDEC